jgi:hypothetical protein
MQQDATGRGLTARHIQAIAELAGGASVPEAASTIGVHRATVHRWTKDPAFVAELRRVEGEALRQLGRVLLSKTHKVSAALDRALDPEAPLSAQLRAAEIVTTKGLALAESGAMLERMEAIEAMLERIPEAPRAKWGRSTNGG